MLTFICATIVCLADKPRTIPEIIEKAALRYYVSPEVALRIAKCESNFNQNAKNPHSSALGIYQFTETTWEYTHMPGDRGNPIANIYAFMELYPKHPNWWKCQ